MLGRRELSRSEKLGARCSTVARLEARARPTRSLYLSAGAVGGCGTTLVMPPPLTSAFSTLAAWNERPRDLTTGASIRAVWMARVTFRSW